MSNWRWLTNYIFPIKGQYMSSIALESISMFAAMGMIFVQKLVIDEIFTNGRYDWFIPIISLFVVIVIIYFATHAYAYVLAQKCQMQLFSAMSGDLLHLFQRIPMSTLRKDRIARLSNFFNQEIFGTANHLAYKVLHGVVDSLKLLLLAVVIGVSSPMVLAMILVCGILYIAQSKYFGPKFKASSTIVHDRRSSVSVVMEEGIASSREVLIYSREAWEKKRLNHVFQDFLTSYMQEGKLFNKQLISSESLKWITNLLLLAVVGYQVLEGQLSIGTLIVIYLYGSQLLDVMNSVYTFFVRTSSQMGAVERLREVMESSAEPDGDVPLQQPIASVELKDVIFRYADHAPIILDRVSFKLEPGSRTAIVGPSGSGKSTIIQLLSRFYSPTGGEIGVNCKSLSVWKQADWASKCAIVFQEPYFLPDTIRTNLLLGRELESDEQLTEVCKIAEIHEFIMSQPDGYETILGERGINLSGGERQRLAIARALLGQPELLILDEATSALDQETEMKLQNNLSSRYKDMTQLIVAHRLETIKHADVIHVMDKGSLVESGNYEDLLSKNSLFARMVLAEKKAV